MINEIKIIIGNKEYVITECRYKRPKQIREEFESFIIHILRQEFKKEKGKK